MTRSITIVNTSNWDGEDYLIGIPGVEGQVRIRPGESVTFTPLLDEHGADSPGAEGSCHRIALREDVEKAPVPFEVDMVEEDYAKWPKTGYRKSKQVFPKVRVTIE